MIENVNQLGGEGVRVLANVTHTHDIIIKAAQIAQKMIEFKDNPKVKSLKFTKPNEAVGKVVFETKPLTASAHNAYHKEPTFSRKDPRAHATDPGCDR